MSSGQPRHPDATEKIPLLLQIAIKKFNAGEYFACHEYLEELWLNKQDPKRDLYKGILQIGIGLRHLQLQKRKGAKQLLEHGALLIEPFLPICYGIDLLNLHRDTETVLHRLNDPNQPHSFQRSDAIQIQAQWIS